jgi:hypothetical protein
MADKNPDVKVTTQPKRVQGEYMVILDHNII